MQALFGHFCSENSFIHDQMMYAELERRECLPARKRRRELSPEDTQQWSQASAESLVARYASEAAMMADVEGANPVSAPLEEAANANVNHGSGTSLGREVEAVTGLDLLPDPERTLNMIREAFKESSGGQA